MKNLKILRKQQGLGQIEMAKRLNLAKSTYARYEIGETEPDLDTLIKLADYFGCSVDYLLGHQTNSIVQLEMLTNAQREVMNLVKTLDDKEAYSVVGYINHMRGTPLNDLVEKILNEGRK